MSVCVCVCVQTMSVGCAGGGKHRAEVCSSCVVAPRPSQTHARHLDRGVTIVGAAGAAAPGPVGRGVFVPKKNICAKGRGVAAAVTNMKKTAGGVAVDLIVEGGRGCKKFRDTRT